MSAPGAVSDGASGPRAPGRYYINSWAGRTGQRLAARMVDSLLAFGVVVAVIAVGPHGRPLGQDLIMVVLIAGAEALFVARSGATPGMHVMDLRVVEVGRSGNPALGTAWRRAVPVALCYPILSPGFVLVAVMPFALLLSIGLSPLRRGFHDRLSDTVVVQKNAPASITDDDLASWWQPDQELVMTPWGRVPDLRDRRRARAHRVDGAWWLAATIVILTVVSLGLIDLPRLWFWLTGIWIIVASIDEYLWLTTRGATPGHTHFGYRVVDVETGEPPGRARAAIRAVISSILLYLPPFQLVLALWVRISSQNRGPHDLAARTVVVEPDHRVHAFVPWTPPAPAYHPMYYPGSVPAPLPRYLPPPPGSMPLPPPPPIPPPPVSPPPPAPPDQHVPGPF